MKPGSPSKATQSPSWRPSTTSPRHFPPKTCAPTSLAARTLTPPCATTSHKIGPKPTTPGNIGTWPTGDSAGIARGVSGVDGQGTWQAGAGGVAGASWEPPGSRKDVDGGEASTGDDDAVAAGSAHHSVSDARGEAMPPC